MWRDPLAQFRWIGWAEAISFLALLGVAMPLKYLAGMPLAVRIVGSLHGGLFLLYVVAAFRAAQYGRWSAKQLLWALIASLLPFGPLVVNHQLDSEQQGSSPRIATDDT